MADKKTGKHANKALMNTLCTVQIMPALEFMFHDLTMEEYKQVKRYQLTWFFVGLAFIVLSAVFISLSDFGVVYVIFGYVFGILSLSWICFPSFFTTYLRVKNTLRKR